jgi:hypothetical protein
MGAFNTDFDTVNLHRPTALLLLFRSIASSVQGLTGHSP